ncbi:MAG TPA: hypothetical protein DCQ30_02175 [Acidimicrobiaceae bacterium]|nr:hypothetical protein [Acidimicrobiaceae bacterium]
MPARYDLPIPDDYTRTWWDAAAERRLLIVRCAACGRAHYYPRPFCPRCGADEVAWEEASGQATLYTWSVVHQNDLPPFRDKVPYVAAVVDLAEGPRMMTNVVGAEPESLRVAMALRVDFEELDDDFHIPVFRPAG